MREKDLMATTTIAAHGKFEDPRWTRDGAPRASVGLGRLTTLWINTGTLCNLTCANCYIESSPRNDRLAYITADELRVYLDEIARDGLDTTTIGFTGGEPFMNPELRPMLEDVLARGFSALVLTNAMRPMHKCQSWLTELKDRFGDRLTLRVSVDHYTRAVHEAERGRQSWQPTIAGLVWLVRNGFSIAIAGRRFTDEPVATVRQGYAALLDELGIALDLDDPTRFMLFPEMDPHAEVPEISEACWGILKVSPDSIMCASSRMVVKRKGADAPAVLACTLLPYDPQFELGRTLAEASRPVALNHPNCARFCVLGGASCG